MKLWTGLAVLFFSGMLYADNIEIPFISDAPKIDGKLDDKAWQKAVLTRPFKKYSSGVEPADNTIARLCYDSCYLYIAFECSQKDGIVSIVNQETVDAPVFRDDNVELFFAPAEKGDTFHIAIAYRGIRWDALNEKPELWDGEWECASSRDGNHWKMEIRIPFADLAQPGFPQGTPVAGETWKMNLARTHSSNTEWSQLSFAKTGGFGNRDAFVPVAFGKRPAPYDLTLKVKSPGTLTLGRSEIGLEVENIRVNPFDIVCTLSRKNSSGWNDKIIDMHRYADTAAVKTVKIPYELDQGGEYKLNLAVRSYCSASPLSVWTMRFSAADLYEDIKALETKITGIGELNSKITEQEFRHDAEKNLNGLQEILSALKGGADDIKKGMTGESGNVLSNRNAKALVSADMLERKVQKQVWRESVSSLQRNPDFCVGNASVFDHVFRDKLFSGKINQPMSLKAAKNEMENLQIVVIPLNEAGVKNATVEMTDMKQENGGAILPAGQWKIGEVQYIEKPRPANAAGDFIAFWPDVIMPHASVNVPADWQTPVSLRVKIPEDQAAGIYRGTLKVQNARTSFNLPVELEVFDFALPKTGSLKTESWLRFYPLRRYYKNDHVTLKHYERILKDFEGYRISMGLYDYFTLGPKLKLIREEYGRLTVDFSEFDKWVDLAVKYGANSFNLNLNCSDGMATLFAGGWGYPMLQITDRKTGEVSPYPAKCKWPAPEIWDNPDFISFWQQYWKHAGEKGWDKIAYVENVDEPNSDERKALLIKTHHFFRKYCPGLKLTAYGVTPLNFKQAVGLMDEWRPLLRSYEEVGSELRKRQKQGEAIWIYTCGSPGKNSQGGYTPEVYLDTPLLDKRIPPMICWKYNIDGLFQFTINSLRAAPNGRIGEYPILHDPPAVCQFGNGDQLWPGPELFQLLSSLRFETMRDGREDYEYLLILRKAYDQLKRNNDPADRPLLKESAVYLEIPSSLLKDTMTWCHDPGQWMIWRNNVARQIVKLQDAIKKTGSTGK